MRNETYLFAFTYCLLSNTGIPNPPLQKNKRLWFDFGKKISLYLMAFFVTCANKCFALCLCKTYDVSLLDVMSSTNVFMQSLSWGFSQEQFFSTWHYFWPKKLNLGSWNLRWYRAVQCFPTGVPRHTRVPWRGVRGAAKYWINYLLSFFLLLRVTQIGFLAR